MSVKVLVVDDESVTIRVVTHTLKTIGIQVAGASDPAQALELAGLESFSMAILDINLPGMDGFELMAQLRKIPAMSAVPIILFTARSEQDDKQNASRAGAVGFLYKPFSTQELRDLVTKHLPAS